MKVILRNCGLVFQSNVEAVNLVEGMSAVAGKYYTATGGKYSDGSNDILAYETNFDVTEGETIYLKNVRFENSGVRDTSWTVETATSHWQKFGESGTKSGAVVVPFTGKMCISINASNTNALVTRSKKLYDEWNK